MSLSTITPILVVDAIEPLLPSWKALGFAEAMRMDHGAHLGFVMLVREGHQVMVQSRASLAEDLPPIAEKNPQSLLYLDVTDVDAEVQKADRAPLVGPRTMPYGRREAWFEDGAGTFYALAQKL